MMKFCRLVELHRQSSRQLRVARAPARKNQRRFDESTDAQIGSPRSRVCDGGRGSPGAPTRTLAPRAALPRTRRSYAPPGLHSRAQGKAIPAPAVAARLARRRLDRTRAGLVSHELEQPGHQQRRHRERQSQAPIDARPARTAMLGIRRCRSSLHFRLPQKRWMRWQASSRTSFEVA